MTSIPVSKAEGTSAFSSKEEVSSSPIASFEGRTVEDLKNRLKEIKETKLFRAQSNLQKMPSDYSETYSCANRITGILVVALVITAVASIYIHLAGGLSALTGRFCHWFQHLDKLTYAIAGSTILVLASGAIIVIYKAVHKKEKLLERRELEVFYTENGVEKTVLCTTLADIPKENSKASDGPVIKVIRIIKNERIEIAEPERGSFTWVGDHMQTVSLGRQTKTRKVWLPGYADTSTLNGGNGNGYVYGIKIVGDHYFVSTVVTLIGTPLLLIGTIVYNIIRAVIAPLYVLIQYLREKCTGQTLYPNERPFELSDISGQLILSISRLIKAPFYALALFIAGLYSLINPMGGRKLGAAIEEDWNEDISLAQGFWSVQGRKKLWKWEGGGGPMTLGQNGYYLAGCWQPIALAEWKDNLIVAAYWLPKAIDPNCGNNDAVVNRTVLKQYLEENEEKMTALMNEYESIESYLKDLGVSV